MAGSCLACWSSMCIKADRQMQWELHKVYRENLVYSAGTLLTVIELMLVAHHTVDYQTPILFSMWMATREAGAVPTSADSPVDEELQVQRTDKDTPCGPSGNGDIWCFWPGSSGFLHWTGQTYDSSRRWLTRSMPHGQADFGYPLKNQCCLSDEHHRTVPSNSQLTYHTYFCR